MSIEFIRLNLKEFSQESWKEYVDFRNSYLQTRLPGSATADMSEIRTRLENPAEYYETSTYLIYKDQKIVGDSSAFYENKLSPTYEKNGHLMMAEPKLPDSLSPEEKKSFLDFIISKAKEVKHLTTINVVSFDEKFAQILTEYNAKRVMNFSTFRLFLKDVDWKQIGQWIDNGVKRNPVLRLEFLKEIPTKYIEQFCHATTAALAQMPHEDMDMEFKLTPETLKSQLRRMKLAGKEMISCIVFDENDEIAGFTDLTYNLKRVVEIDQEMTYVMDKYRGSGIGRWMKGAMISYVKEHYSEVTYVTTGSAGSNKYMIAINTELGFANVLDGSIHALSI